MNQRRFPWPVLVGIFAALVVGCGEDECPEQPHNTAPTACFSVSPTEGTTETVFQVDASCASDGQDSPPSLEIRWDWENDGTWDTDYSPTKITDHQYGAVGAKTIKLEVKDTAGLTDTETRQVTVSAVPPPVQGFVLLQPGTFTMGSPETELCRAAYEAQHEVTFTHAFYVSVTEVTQADWVAVMGWNDSDFDGANRPVEEITWFDAVSYCNERSTDEGFMPAYTITGAIYDGNHITEATVSWNRSANGYRLLTEAEWEYACRATSQAAFCNGSISECGYGSEPNLVHVGWYGGNSGDQTHDVGTKSPNAWGLYDMHGNVCEWCWDRYGGYGGAVTDPAGPPSGYFGPRVLRGGNWRVRARSCRSAYRYYYEPVIRDFFVGLRLARTEWWGDTPPTACFTVDPDSGTTETTFQIDASCCTDGQDPVSALQVRWDWENDGTWDTDYSATKTAGHQYATGGARTIKLEVKDTEELTGTTSRTVKVTSGPPVPGSMVLVPAGTFTMGDGVAYWGVDQREVTLTHSFYLGQYEVANQEYRDALQWAYDHRYVAATSSGVTDNLDGSTAPLVDLAESHCQVSFSGGSFTVDPGKENYPMVDVSWYGAAAYCDWLSMGEGRTRAYDHSTWQCNAGNPYGAAGYRLPTDAEWEYAAQYDDERIYPWGNEDPDCDRANYDGCAAYATKVGSYPAAPAALGLYDMAGNVWEWCNDWHTCRLGTSPESDPAGPTSASARVRRGGSWGFFDSRVRCADRDYNYPGYAYPIGGFRCARSQ